MTSPPQSDRPGIRPRRAARRVPYSLPRTVVEAGGSETGYRLMVIRAFNVPPAMTFLGSVGQENGAGWGHQDIEIRRPVEGQFLHQSINSLINPAEVKPDVAKETT